MPPVSYRIWTHSLQGFCDILDGISMIIFSWHKGYYFGLGLKVRLWIYKRETRLGLRQKWRDND